MRWWQRLAATRLLEHDAEGRLVWRNVLITLARQCGKSWLIRALIIWRIQHRDLFGDEDQTVVSIAHKFPTAIEVWRPAARWASGEGWRVRWGSGDQCIETPDGGRWLIAAAMDGVGVGFALSGLIVDEGWMIKRSVVEAADPALSESESPQLWLVSTAGDSASDLFGTYRLQALDTLSEPSNILLVEWSAPRDSQLADRSAWRSASPFWSTKREAEIVDKLGKMDPLEFKQNYLNIWVDGVHGRAEVGLPVFAESEWLALDGVEVPATPPAVTAVESWFKDGVSVASGWLLPSGQVLVGVVSYPTASEALRVALSLAAAQLVVGKSLAGDPELRQAMVSPEPAGSTTRQAVAALRQLVDDDIFRHDGSQVLAEQALALRTLPGADGPRVKSAGRADAIKAAVWAVERARLAAEGPMIF
jgi:hypothetical protein